MTDAVLVARISQNFQHLSARDRNKRLVQFFSLTRPSGYTGGHKQSMMEKRKVTAEDLQNHPQLGLAGAKEGDDVTFLSDGNPQLESGNGNAAENGNDGASEGTGGKRLVSAEDLEGYPQLGELGAKVGDEWSADWNF